MLDSRDSRPSYDELLTLCRREVEFPEQLADDFFEARGPVEGPPELRKYQRFALRHEAVLQYRTTLPALRRSPGWYCVYTKDLSRKGLGFIHSEQLYPRERMAIVLHDNSWRMVEVVRCERLGVNCYLVGAYFVAEAN